MRPSQRRSALQTFVCENAIVYPAFDRDQMVQARFRYRCTATGRTDTPYLTLLTIFCRCVDVQHRARIFAESSRTFRFEASAPGADNQSAIAGDLASRYNPGVGYSTFPSPRRPRAGRIAGQRPAGRAMIGVNDASAQFARASQI